MLVIIVYCYCNHEMAFCGGGGKGEELKFFHLKMDFSRVFDEYFMNMNSMYCV